MIKKKGNLIFVWNYLEWGGAQIYFLAIMKKARESWDIKVILPRKSSTDIIGYIEEIGIECEFIDVSFTSKPAITFFQKLQRQISRIRTEVVCYLKLRQYLNKKNVIHIEAAPWQSWILLWLLARKTNVFLTVHNALSKVSNLRNIVWKSRLKFLSKLSDFHILTANTDAKNSLKPFVNREFWQKIKITYASINPQEISDVLNYDFSKAELCEKLKLPVETFKILCVGQFIDRKGRWIFLKAAEEVIRQKTNVSFIWLMPELPDQSEQKKIQTFNLQGCFYPVLSTILGKQRKNVLNFFRLADVFVLASYLEGLPISLLEAMALKIPCVTTNVNSIPEAVKHRETGILIDSGNSQHLSRVILELIDNAALRDELGLNGSKLVLNEFDESNMAEIVIDEYSKCV